MKTCNSENVNGFRVVIGCDFQDLTVPDFELLEHIDVKAQNPHVENPDGDSSPGGEISRKFGFVGNWKVVELDDYDEDDHDWQGDADPDAHYYRSRLGFLPFFLLLWSFRLVAALSSWPFLFLNLIVFDFVVEYWVEFFDAWAFNSNFVKVCYKRILSWWVFLLRVVRGVLAQLKLFVAGFSGSTGIVGVSWKCWKSALLVRK